METKRDARLLEAQRKRHEARHPDGCGDTWESMCDSCVKRIASAIEPHPEVEAHLHVRAVIMSLETSVRYYGKRVAGFSADLADDAAHAFELAGGAAEAAAKIGVAQLLLDIIRHPDGGLENAFRRSHAEMVRGARWPKSSAAPSSTLMAQFTTAAWAEFYAIEYEYRYGAV